MKILFIYKYEYLEPQGIMQLSSFLKKHGHSCDFIDLQFEKDYASEVARISPDIIAYSITTGKHRCYQSLNLELKKKFKFFAFFGGPHCTFFPNFIHQEGVDAICRGEGEFPFLDLVDNLENGKNITKIENLWVKDNGKVHQNEMRNFITDLDILPFADRELINKYSRYKKMHIRFVLSGRGCPYKCSYCFNHSYNKLYQNKGKVIRKRSIASVIEELKFIKDTYRPRKFQFMDDTFNLDYKWTLDFCDAYRKEVSIPLIVILRVNLVREEIVKALKNAGCITVVTGIESGNDYLRNNILMRDISQKQILDACGLFNKYKISSLLQNIVGLPDETLDMAFETMALNIKCKPAYAWASIFQPYPMTELSRYSQAKGYFDGDVNSFEESLFYKSVMRTKDIRKLERLHHLFSLGVAFPLLRPVIKVLIRLPLNRLYLFLWNLHRAWCYFFKVKFIDFSELFIRDKAVKRS